MIEQDASQDSDTSTALDHPTRSEPMIVHGRVWQSYLARAVLVGPMGGALLIFALDWARGFFQGKRSFGELFLLPTLLFNPLVQIFAYSQSFVPIVITTFVYWAASSLTSSSVIRILVSAFSGAVSVFLVSGRIGPGFAVDGTISGATMALVCAVLAERSQARAVRRSTPTSVES